MSPVYCPPPDEEPIPKKHYFKFLERVPASRWRAVSIIIPLLALAVISLLPLQMDRPMQYTLAILVCISMLWTFGMIPLAVTALLVPVLLVGFGVFSPVEALQPFADPVVYLLVGGLIIAETFRKNGMDKRLAYYLVTMAKGDLRRTLMALIASSALMSMWISNTATVALLIPVALGVASHAGDCSKKVGGFFLIGITMGTGFGALSTMISSPTNAITSALLAKVVDWGFVNWIAIGIPTALALLVLLYVLLPWVIKPPSVDLDLSTIAEKRSKLGPMKRMEIMVLIVFGFTVILWVMGDAIAMATGLPSGIMNSGIVALLSAVVMFIIGAVDWNDAKNIAWDVFLIIGAGLALGEALEVTGGAKFLAEGLASMAGASPLIVVMLLFGVISFIVTTVLSNTATAALLVPIAISTSASLGIDPTPLALTVGMVASISYITPVGTPPMTLAYSTGTFSRKELAKSGIIVGIPAMCLIVGIIYVFFSFGIV